MPPVRIPLPSGNTRTRCMFFPTNLSQQQLPTRFWECRPQRLASPMTPVDSSAVKWVWVKNRCRKWNPIGTWSQGPNPAVCPRSLNLSHTPNRLGRVPGAEGAPGWPAPCPPPGRWQRRPPAPRSARLSPARAPGRGRGRGLGVKEIRTKPSC